MQILVQLPALRVFASHGNVKSRLCLRMFTKSHINSLVTRPHTVLAHSSLFLFISNEKTPSRKRFLPNKPSPHPAAVPLAARKRHVLFLAHLRTAGRPEGHLVDSRRCEDLLGADIGRHRRETTGDAGRFFVIVGGGCLIPRFGHLKKHSYTCSPDISKLKQK